MKNPAVDRAPRLTGDYAQDMPQIAAWMATAYRQLVVADAAAGRVKELVAGVTALEQSISDPPTQAEVAAVQALANEILAALKGS